MCTQVRVDFYVFICIICIICIFLVNNKHKPTTKNKNHKNTFVLVETKSLMLRLHALSSERAHRQRPQPQHQSRRDFNQDKSKNIALRAKKPFFTERHTFLVERSGTVFLL